MNPIKLFLACALIAATGMVRAQKAEDSLRTQRLQEVAIVASPKESVEVRQRASSATLLDRQQLQTQGVESLKEVQTMVPNFFMPDYGSHQTSAIYIRGIGSRIGTPAVGLMVDGIPYYDKSAFDFSLSHAEALEVARGPQSTLYGRNTMGGLVKVRTRSPFQYQGTDVHLGYASHSQQRRASFTHYHRPSDAFAFSVGAFYEGQAGFFRHDITNQRMDSGDAAGVRLRGIFKANQRLTFDASVHYEYTGEGAYPYYYTGVTKGNETFATGIGRITNNLDGHYRRHLVNAGVHTEYRLPRFTLHATTAYQHIADHMAMDQDFIAQDIYQLTQRQRINVLSQEVILKTQKRAHYEGLMGANFYYEWQGVQGPVTFRRDGVTMLNTLINTQANSHMPSIAAGPMTMHFLFNDQLQGNALLFDNDFRTPSLGAALFHQSRLSDLFGVEGLSATVGLRLDYERQWLNYSAWYDFQHTYSLQGHLVMTGMERDIAMVPSTDFSVSNHSLAGEEGRSHVQLLPKFELNYAFRQGNVYANVSRGFRSGGYNVQNISELMRSQMQADMMGQVRDVTLPVLQAQPMVPQATKEQVTAILNHMAEAPQTSVDDACGYNPEHAWNFEVGTHLNLFDHHVQCDVSAFFSDIRSLQLSQMSASGLGRIIANAGRSSSAGVEVALRAHLLRHLTLNASYGFTHATLRDYQVTASDGSTLNYAGNHVPYMPQHTLMAGAEYAFPLHGRLWQTLTIGADASGAGRIWWNEANDRSQPFYALLGAHIGIRSKHTSLQVWGRNLTDTRYNAFWFESASRGYEQHGRPLQIGMDINLRF